MNETRGTVQMVKLKEGYQVYTRTVGKGIPILLLHGGPGANHTCFTIFEKYVDLDRFSLVYYDQLGSLNSDQIADEALLSLPRYVDEVEQVRAALGLEKFILLGHSWGGILCMEYALKYEKEGHMLGMVISNMVDSGAVYQEYLEKVRERVLTEEELDYARKIEAEGRDDDPRYRELIDGKLNSFSLCRLDPPPAFLSAPGVPNPVVYRYFQGDNEFVMTGAAKDWDRSGDIHKIQTKTLAFGGRYDTMDPERMEHIGREVQNGRSYICPEGSHLCFWDDSEHYFAALNEFLDTL